MQAPQLLIPHDIRPTYNAHNLFDHHTASPRVLLGTNDIQPLPPSLQLRMPQNQPPLNNVPPPKQEQKLTKAVGIPAITPDGVVMVDDPESRSTRSYTPVKLVGDGSFGTVWLCDWQGALPINTPLSPMQCGAGARPDWAGKRLVALKRMKKRWEGGWEECKRLKELESLRVIPRHPNIIPLYDFFVMPSTKELYFVFECMEGNLYQLIRSRKGRSLAGGLVSSIFRQVCSGLHHIHQSGYFHRDMKPENLLVTTTGLHDYLTTNPRLIAAANSNGTIPTERDVAVIVKLADFGLARETTSRPPYTEYVSTRWYRAPEVLLRSRDYSNPVDTWALGTIMAELVNLRPLFPGQGETDQVALICEVLGDPSDDYGIDERGVCIGGGSWPKGIRMASSLGYAFGKHETNGMMNGAMSLAGSSSSSLPSVPPRHIPLPIHSLPRTRHVLLNHTTAIFPRLCLQPLFHLLRYPRCLLYHPLRA
ncbi:kinase-like domain-containing protein [Cantharellus anzutake]|uniref:kinase-like domain-containing protein n=1 Tax=Cantharellus anzutake TaxID=1750568 RepID=UPI001905561D|nr:kinase-like domain-containing protein [Cantharellus anzutake]KAF8339735.1 kinase-like domain-containing protein [Cantharellus anzutake]